MRVDLRPGILRCEHGNDAQLARDEVEARTTEHLAISFHDHPALHVRMQCRDVGTELLVLPTVHAGAYLSPAPLPFLEILRRRAERRDPADPTPGGQAAQRSGVAEEEVGLQQRLLDGLGRCDADGGAQRGVEPSGGAAREGGRYVDQCARRVIHGRSPA